MEKAAPKIAHHETPNEANARRRSILKRRRFLQGLGVSIALPTFASLVPRGARAQGDRPQRLLTLYHPNGMPKSHDDWLQHRSEIDADLLEPFSSVAGRMGIARNMNEYELKKQNVCSATHGHMANFLCLYTGDPILAYGQESKTFDQYIAEDERHQGSARASISINMGMKTRSHQGVEPVYFNSPSWKGPGQAIAPFADPRRLFEDLFGRGGMVGGDPVADAARRALLERKQLFLDVAVDQIHSLKTRLGREDQMRLDEYLTSVEELDRRTQSLLGQREEIEAMCSADGAPVEVIDGQSVRIPQELYVETMGVMQDIVVRAFQCDLTRVATFAHCGPAGGGFALNNPWVEGMEGRSTNWHGLSHWFDATSGGDPRVSTDFELNRRDFKRIIKWHYSRMAEFVAKLANTPGTWDNDSLLDETLVTAGTSMAYPGHNNGMLHQFLFGSANGAFNEGVDIDLDFDWRVGTKPLWLTVLRGFGIDIDRYGPATESLSAMLA